MFSSPPVFSSRARDSQLSRLSPALLRTLPRTWSTFSGYRPGGEGLKSTGRVHSSLSHKAGSLWETRLLLLPGDKIVVASGRVEEEGGAEFVICADQFWPDLLKCFVLALLLLSYFFFPCSCADLSFLNPARPV